MLFHETAFRCLSYEHEDSTEKVCRKTCDLVKSASRTILQASNCCWTIFFEVCPAQLKSKYVLRQLLYTLFGRAAAMKHHVAACLATSWICIKFGKLMKLLYTALYTILYTRLRTVLYPVLYTVLYTFWPSKSRVFGMLIFLSNLVYL